MAEPVIAFLRKPIAWVIGAVIIAGLIWWLVTSLMGGKSAKVEAELNRNQAGAALESGKDAVGVVGGVGERASDADRITQENRDAIGKAKGADAAIEPEALDAGIRALCRRKAYQDSEVCRGLAK